MTMWGFWNEHWFLAFIAMWSIVTIITNVIKYVTVLFRGWPEDGKF